MTITDRDMRDEVTRSLTDYVGDHDVEAIVAELKTRYGLVRIDAIPYDAYWETVRKHRSDPPVTRALHVLCDRCEKCTLNACEIHLLCYCGIRYRGCGRWAPRV